MDIGSPRLTSNTSLGSFDCSTQRETMKTSSSRDVPPVDLDLGIAGHETDWTDCSAGFLQREIPSSNRVHRCAQIQRVQKLL